MAGSVGPSQCADGQASSLARQPASGAAPFERRDCRRRDARQRVNRTRNVTAAQLTELCGSLKTRWRARFSTTSDRSAGSNGGGPDAGSGAKHRFVA